MINRELIRNKVVQLTYAYYQNGSKNIDSAEKELFFSLSKAYDLYNHLLSLMAAVSKETTEPFLLLGCLFRVSVRPSFFFCMAFSSYLLQFFGTLGI